MRTISRLPEPYGSRIDRSRPIEFTFDGKALTGYAGDTIASALAANGRWVLSRSFKYHRPRGILSLAGHEANTLVQVGKEPNVRADLRLIEPGMRVEAQNVMGSVERDRKAAVERMGRFLPVGFYYRSFMGPGRKGFQKIWEPFIRSMSGLGRVYPDTPPKHYGKVNLFCDVLVVGGGPAGISAASAAAKGGAGVLLVDENPELGGSLGDARSRITVLANAVATGCFADNFVTVVRDDVMYRVRAKEIVFATGSLEQPAIFHNNDLPGIMLASAAQRLMRWYGVRPGSRAVVVTNDDKAYAVASDLRAAGVEVAATVDMRAGERIWEARSANGSHVSGVHVTPIGKRTGRWIACDLVCMSAGSMPAWQLPSQIGAKVAFDLEPLQLEPHPHGKDFVDFDEDVQVVDIENAIAEGYADVELVKRFTTASMGVSQGKHSALATASLVAAATGVEMSKLMTTSRPPSTPEKMGVAAGPHYDPYRLTPMHHRHVETGARMIPVNPWWRPAYYGAILTEVKAVREGVGMIDMSTLGGFDVRGPDAAEFLDRLYTFEHGSQRAGRIRYALMLNEMGTIADDGVIWRMSDDHFYVTATTAAAARTYQAMLFWNAQWRMNVDVLNVTAAFARINVAGPRSRELLAPLSDDIDFSKESFPFVEGRSGHIAGVAARVLRIGYTGELSYEIHVPASYGEALWDRLLQEGKALELRPFGLDASRILRLEKGHIIIGQDTDALSTPDEAGLGWAVSRRKRFFIGKRALEMRKRNGIARRLVAFEVPPQPAQAAESCLVLDGGSPIGHVTSTCLSPSLGLQIGLALIKSTANEQRSNLEIKARSGTIVRATVVTLPFYDPHGERQRL